MITLSTVCVCVHACVHACVRACVHVKMGGGGMIVCSFCLLLRLKYLVKYSQPTRSAK